MAKMTVAEAAQHFNVSKEAIHNRVRRGTLDCVIDHGIKYIVVGEANTPKPNDDSRYYDYIEKENERLKLRIETLEAETRQLRDQREQMLIDERRKIEQIYKERDEQLKNVLQVVASKFLSHMNVDHVIEEAVTAEVIDEAPRPEEGEELVSLKAFLKLKQLKKKHKEKIKERFAALAGREERVIEKEGKLYLDLNRYSYADLLS